jgi:primosomal protein N' (replication factor Y)
MLLLIQGNKEKDVKKRAHELRGILLPMSGEKGLEVLGPAPAPIPRIKKKYRWQILIKAPGHRLLAEAFSRSRKALKGTSKLSVSIDVDPLSAL